ncbi:16S rRNA (uracil(1498)-N(3))-methyltransferase [Moraxella nasibovis]|uniref:16S rRNA (uracil(1498)-N(3))-methyltransferase n=1 Tax=Moraxella nasibovis TaxID=2904120 RepID=UPI00240F4F07|nr:16S rRNA (uracil(1498)-N(3))-methyltransferase [Moraxella nasibovis]WFF38230.1 16S rRNA (uracil(1498)-N(3))-methyltransferase [Moraxella nasibovis]
MPRFYIDTPLFPNQIGQEITLTDTIYHHWCKVLRAKNGDTGILFDGNSGEYAVYLTEIDKKQAKVFIKDFNPINRTPPFIANIGLVMSRGDRMDYAIQKACEMGVSRIQLLTSERCQEHLKYERDKKKITHWQGVAIAACEQCGMNLIPEILPPIALTEFVEHCQDELKLVLALSDGQVDFGAYQDNFPKTISLLIGGEGGLSPNEIELARSHGFLPWTIGERVLRTETAPVVALTALHTIWDIYHK